MIVSSRFYMNNPISINRQKVKEALKDFTLPWSPHIRLLDTDLIETLHIENQKIHITLKVPNVDPAQVEPLRAKIEHHLSQLKDVEQARVFMNAISSGLHDPTISKRLVFPPKQTGHTKSDTTSIKANNIKNAKPIETLNSVKCVIAIASGKGGVGKSSTTVNLAIALSQKGLKVGIMDADIYGPSIPHMLDLKGKVEVRDHKLIPMTAWGISAISIGMLVPTNQAVIWRGPMVMGAVKQLLSDVKWGELDIMLIDMPPGTGDVQITLGQSIKLDGAIMVSTPQDIALLDAKRGIYLFQKTRTPILGIIENMSYFLCPRCQEKTYIFGQDGVKKEAKALNIPFLGEIPILPVIRTASDEGIPITVQQPDGPESQAYHAIADLIYPAICKTGLANSKNS